MTHQRSSIEATLKKTLTVIAIMVGALLCITLYLSGLSNLVIITVLIVSLSIGLPLLFRFYHQLLQPLVSLSVDIEAIRIQDYSIRSTIAFKQGIVGQLSTDLQLLRDELQQQKDRNSQDVFLLYRLIEQLDIPILILDQTNRLSHANDSFSIWYRKPWQSLKDMQAERIGLERKGSQWRFLDPQLSIKWQIKLSQFVDGRQNFQLLILNNIEQEIRDTQQRSWQQIIRVLSHEIRNSLTPIKSLAQTLAERPNQDKRSEQALEIIIQRSAELQQFVNRYSNINKKLKLNIAAVETQSLVKEITALFPGESFITDNQLTSLYADINLLKQVLINLVKNAIEASVGKEDSDNEIRIELIERNRQHVIKVIDQGKGIANTENLFVPFYTTKPDGHGIGLDLCRNIIEQHNGTLTLVNNTNARGATAEIALPQQL